MKVTVELDNIGHLRVCIPPSVEDGKPHHVFIPFSITGLVALHNILARREAPGPHTIGTEGAPTQQMIRAFLATHRVPEPPLPAKVKPKGILSELDLTGIEI